MGLTLGDGESALPARRPGGSRLAGTSASHRRSLVDGQRHFTSSNPTLVPNANIVFGGSGANRTVTLTPAPDQTGNSTITLNVSDGRFIISTISTTSVITVGGIRVDRAAPVREPPGPRLTTAWKSVPAVTAPPELPLQRRNASCRPTSTVMIWPVVLLSRLVTSRK